MAYTDIEVKGELDRPMPHTHSAEEEEEAADTDSRTREEAREDAVVSSVDEHPVGSVIVFRDVICYECSGGLCRNSKYRRHIRHLKTNCQACYKEWAVGEWVMG